MSGELRDDIKDIRRARNSVEFNALKADVRELVRAAHMGRGALWIMLPIGSILGFVATHFVEWLHK